MQVLPDNVISTSSNKLTLLAKRKARIIDHSPSNKLKQTSALLEYPVPAHQAPQSPGVFYFANDPLSRQWVCDQLRRTQPPFSVIMIRSPDDMEQSGLLQQTRLDNGKLQTKAGRLFGDEPLTLIVDLTVFHPGDIASFNDLLQAPPSCNGQPLGCGVKRVFLVSEDMLSGKQPANPDLWRRLRQMNHQVLPAIVHDNTSQSDEDVLASVHRDKPPTDQPVKRIDFSTFSDWHHGLFGGIALNEYGQLNFSEGALSRLPDASHLILQNAPWENERFRTTLADAVRTGGFEANGQWCCLPGHLSFSKEDADFSELETLINQYMAADSETFKPHESFVCVNVCSLEEVKTDFRVNNHKVVRVNRLACLMKGRRQLVITGQLKETQWLWLLGQIEQLPANKRPLLFQNLPVEQLILRDSFRQSTVGRNSRLTSAFHYRVHSSDSLDSLQSVQLDSEKGLTFSISNSELMDCLIRGKPVIFTGLECNPTFAACLETLLLRQPYLFLNGHRIELPKARIILIRPEKLSPTGSSLIDYALASGRAYRQGAKEPVYQLLENLPRDHQKRYPHEPPWSANTFKKRFDQQVEAERRQDRCHQVQPCHQRKALHLLLAKAYRGHPEVYGFIKAKIAQYYPDKNNDTQANQSALSDWLEQHSSPDLKAVRADFWRLARHCPADVHASITSLHEVDERSVRKLAVYLVAAARKSRQQAMAKLLEVRVYEAQALPLYNGILRSTLRDCLKACRNELLPERTISETRCFLERKIVQIQAMNCPDLKKEHLIQSQLEACFSSGRLPALYQDLPKTLLDSRRHTQAHQEQKLICLDSTIQTFGAALLLGEPGAGKTFTAQKVAARAGYQNCQVIQVGPNSTQESLFGGLQLVSVDGASSTDRRTAFCEGPILQWALNKNPPLLVLDEANLAVDGVLSPLVGVTETPAVIHYRGYAYPLTEKHRIILTGNPDHYEGRHLDSALASVIPTLFYTPLPEDLLIASVLEPGLPRHWSAERRQQACERMLTLFHFYKELVPDDLATPRDLLDVLATIRQILKHHYQRTDQAIQEEPEAAQVNALIRRAFMDSLAGAVPLKQQRHLAALNTWCLGQFPEDETLLRGVDQAFNHFIGDFRKRYPNANLAPASMQKLVYSYWQSMDKDDKGKIALLVEGPAGWGKDFLLDNTIKLYLGQQSGDISQSYTHITANPNQWHQLESHVKTAMSRGAPVAISELNLIPSRYLEGLFNGILTGQATAGFRLFATVNPGSFTGREGLSAVLKSRCTQVRLAPLALSDLEGILQQTPGIPEFLPCWLARHVDQLSHTLEVQKSPLQLALDDLLTSARHLATKPVAQWPDAFQKQQWLAIRALVKPLPSIQDGGEQRRKQQEMELKRQEYECIVNSVPGVPTPVMVKLGQQWQFKQRAWTVPDNLSPHQLLQITRMRLGSPGGPIPIQSGRDFGGRNYGFGDILGTQHYFKTRYFPRVPYDTNYYRLKFRETKLSENGEVFEREISWHDGTVNPLDIASEKLGWRTTLKADELPGKVSMALDDQWQALPSLTPSDQLRAIRVTPEVSIELARSQLTGQLLIRYEPLPSDTETSPATIDFIIAPNPDYFNRLSLLSAPSPEAIGRTGGRTGASKKIVATSLSHDETVVLQPGLCNHRLKQLFDQQVFTDETGCEAFAELLDINAIDNLPTRLKRLAAWLGDFQDNKNLVGQGESLLLAMLREKQGVCRHRAMLFQLLCHYWGIPARIVGNKGHRFTEISTDNGATWQQYQLGGGGTSISEVTEPDWDDFDRPDGCELAYPEGHDIHTVESFFRLLEEEIKHLEEKIITGEAISAEKLKRLLENIIEHKETTNNGDILLCLLAPRFYKTLSENQQLCRLLCKVSHQCNHFSGGNSDFEPIVRAIRENQEGYSELLCDLCDQSPRLSRLLAGTLQYCCVHQVDQHPLRERIIQMVNNLKLWEFSKKPISESMGKREGVLRSFVRDLPDSQFLNKKIRSLRIKKSYSSVPQESAQFMPERLAAGQPAFLNERVTQSFPDVIMDFCHIGPSFMEVVAAFARSVTTNEGNVHIHIHLIKKAFAIWLARHKTDPQSVWQWLTNEYAHCHEQHMPDQIPLIRYDDHRFNNSRHSVELSVDQVKQLSGRQSAVVIQEQDLLSLLNEFLELCDRTTFKDLCRQADQQLELFDAAYKGDLQKVKALIKARVNINVSDNKHWACTPLICAATNEQLSVVEYLLNEGADVHAEQDEGFTAIHFAAETGEENLLNILIKSGADVDHQAWDYKEKFPLCIAVTNQKLAAAEVLLRKGANPDNQTLDGYTPLYLAVNNQSIDIVRLLLAHQANPNIREYLLGLTPLMASAFDYNGRLELTRLLLDAGADVNATDNRGLTALLLAAQNGFPEIVSCLLQKEANPNIAMFNGWTPLMQAAQNGHLPIVKELLSCQPTVNATCFKGVTALEKSISNSHSKIALALLEAGARGTAKNYREAQKKQMPQSVLNALKNQLS